MALVTTPPCPVELCYAQWPRAAFLNVDDAAETLKTEGCHDVEFDVTACYVGCRKKKTLCHHCQYSRLSLWQPTLQPVTTRLELPRLVMTNLCAHVKGHFVIYYNGEMCKEGQVITHIESTERDWNINHLTKEQEYRRYFHTVMLPWIYILLGIIFHTICTSLIFPLHWRHNSLTTCCFFDNLFNLHSPFLE